VIQAFNSGVESLLMKAIGLKVWLFYLPLLYIGNQFIRSNNDLVLLVRVMVVSSIIPMCLGISEFLFSLLFGYREVMAAIYGDAASAVTQNFQTYDLGFSLLRIPSTFSYWIQYSSYTFSMVGFTYMLMKIDVEKNWNNFARLMFGISLIAALLSGAKANLIFVPMLLAILLVKEKRFILLCALIFGLLTLVFILSNIIGIDLTTTYELFARLLIKYWNEVVLGGMSEGFSILGLGTGINTGPARVAIENYDYSGDAMIENYYAKALIELGIIGLVLTLLLFATIISIGNKRETQLVSSRLKGASATLLAYLTVIMITSVKGWLIDITPINIYFWFFVGVLFALKRCDNQPSRNLG